MHQGDRVKHRGSGRLGTVQSFVATFDDLGMPLDGEVVVRWDQAREVLDRVPVREVELIR